MELWQLLLITGALTATFIAFIWVAIRLGGVPDNRPSPKDVATASVNNAVNQAFTEEFRDELQQRARRQFDAVMQQNAQFLQQNVRVSAAKLEEFMKQEVLTTLQRELAKHQQVIDQTKQMVTSNITRNEQQHQQELQAEKDRRLKRFEDHMTEVIRSYVVTAAGDVIDQEHQISLVIDSLNAHKAEIYEEIRREQ